MSHATYIQHHGKIGLHRCNQLFALTIATLSANRHKFPDSQKIPSSDSVSVIIRMNKA